MVPFKDCSNLSTILLWIINETPKTQKCVFFLKNADVIKLVNQDLK